MIIIMNQSNPYLSIVIAVLSLFAFPVMGQSDQEPDANGLDGQKAEVFEKSEHVDELDQKIEVLAEEIENIKSGAELFPRVGKGVFGMAPAASKVYGIEKGVSLGGYGEVLYENYGSQDQSSNPSGKIDQLDFLRNIIYVGYRFNEKFLFNSEIEFEHGSTSSGVGSVSVEFAYIDYLHSDLLNIRAGMVLVPMGFVNELHEPIAYLSTERSRTESVIIPSTWRSNGFGLFGSGDKVDYRVFLIQSLNATAVGSSPASGFSSAGFRGGRQKGAKGAAQDFAIVGRLDYHAAKGLMFGGSFFAGQTAQDAKDISGNQISGWTHILEAHAEYRLSGLELRALYAHSFLEDASSIASLVGSDVGSQMQGFYIEAGYDLFDTLDFSEKLILFSRLEKLNTQHKLASNLTQDRSKNGSYLTLGLNFQPLDLIVVKGAYQFQKNKADTGVNQWDISLGYVF